MKGPETDSSRAQQISHLLMVGFNARLRLAAGVYQCTNVEAGQPLVEPRHTSKNRRDFQASERRLSHLPQGVIVEFDLAPVPPLGPPQILVADMHTPGVIDYLG